MCSNTAEKINATIIDFAKRENHVLLDNFGEGLLAKMPELAFTYQLGKEIAINNDKHFGAFEYHWIRESSFSNNGHVDIEFKPNNDEGMVSYLIEGKLDNTYYEYASDIEKRINIIPSYSSKKFFFGIKYVWDKKDADQFLEGLSRNLSNSDLASKMHQQCFLTKDHTGKECQCLYSFWELYQCNSL